MHALRELMISAFYCSATTSWQSNIDWRLDLNEWTCGGNALVLCTAVVLWFSGLDAGTYLFVVTVHPKSPEGWQWYICGHSLGLYYLLATKRLCLLSNMLAQESEFSGMEWWNGTYTPL